MTSPVTRTLLRTLRHLEKEIEEKTNKRRPKSRQGKKAVVCHADPAVAWQLKKLALDRSTTVQAVLEESLADLFEKYHLPRTP